MNRKLIVNRNYILRKVLNKEENKDILQEFIETMLDIKIKKLRLNKYLDDIKNQLPKEENFGIADMRIKLENNQELNIGVQFLDGMYYLEQKLLIYYSQIHLNQEKYEDNVDITKTITINIIDYKIFNTNTYDKKIKLSDKIDDDDYDYDIYAVELPKFNVNPINGYSKKEAWIAYLKGIKFDLENEKYVKIKKLDLLLDDYWKEEIME